MGIRDLIRKSLRNLVEWATQDTVVRDSDFVGYATSKAPTIKGNIQTLDDMSTGLNITVFRAAGGQVIQTSHYDPRTDRSVRSMYVIHDTDDLGAELSQIITRENLSR